MDPYCPTWSALMEKITLSVRVTDDLFNRWILLRVYSHTIQMYVNRKISFKAIIPCPVDDMVYLADIDTHFLHHSIQVIAADEIPAAYIPQEDSYYLQDSRKEFYRRSSVRT